MGHGASVPELSGRAARYSGSVKLLGFDHVQLAMPAGDEAESDAVRFYQGVLGLVRQPKPPVLADLGECWCEAMSVRIHLGVDPDFRPARKAHPALLVADLDSSIDTLKSSDTTITYGERVNGNIQVYLEDPFGNRIELVAASTPSPDQVPA